jgi:hypothetical protein
MCFNVRNDLGKLSKHTPNELRTLEYRRNFLYFLLLVFNYRGNLIKSNLNKNKFMN